MVNFQLRSLKGLATIAVLIISMSVSVGALSVRARETTIENSLQLTKQDTMAFKHELQEAAQAGHEKHTKVRSADGSSMACPVCNMPVTEQNSYLSIKKGKQKLYACSVDHAQLLSDSPMDYADDTLPTTSRRRQTITYVEPKAECPFCGMSGIHEHALNFNGNQAVYACSMSEHYTRIYQEPDLRSAFSGVEAGVDAQAQTTEENTTTTTVPEQHDEPFCYGSGTVMLNGFTFNMDNCITYLFDGWVLDTPLKYAGATILTFIVTILVQVLNKVRVKLEHAQVKRQLADKRQPKVTELLLNSALVLVSVTFGYWVMLLTMTYSMILFLAVVLGLATGHFLSNFFTQRDISNPFSKVIHSDDHARQSHMRHGVISPDTSLGEKKGSCCGEEKSDADLMDVVSDHGGSSGHCASEADNGPAPKHLPDTPCCPY